MATLYQPGNKDDILGSSNTPNSGGIQDEVISKTRDMAFPSGPVISLENFEHYGDKAAGTEQSLQDMVTLTGKELQASYRAGLPMSQKMAQKVNDR